MLPRLLPAGAARIRKIRAIWHNYFPEIRFPRRSTMGSKNTRVEYDSMGEMEVPSEAYYGA
ncbi:MAG: hypothetical protein AB7P53_07090, partial [Candidatus Dadabacteria bacterium]